MSQTHIIKNIPGYEGLYGATVTGHIFSYRSKKFLKSRYLHGREMVHFCVDYKHSFHFVHRLVYTAFKGIIPDNLEIDHINENKTDNRLENLQAITHQENVQKYFDLRSVDKIVI